MKFRNLVAALALTVPTLQSVNAMTVEEMLKDDSEMIANYLAGIIDMMGYQEVMNGNRERASCLNEWYFETEGTMEKLWSYFDKYPDRFPGAIIYVLAKRSCPLEG